MIDTYEKDLHNKVNIFKKWAIENYPFFTEDSDNGEWEIGSDEFDDILYAIARDNECSRIIQALNEFPRWYSVLCRQCLKSTYTNAKWQFAESLKDYKGCDDLSPVIYKFLEVGDEYTERLALMSLAYIYPEQAEAYAIKFWNRNKYQNDEYQKIMAIHVLHKIQSSKLLHFLELAKHSHYRYLKQNAKEICEKLTD